MKRIGDNRVDKYFEKLEKILHDKINGVGRLSNNFLLVKYYDNKGITRELADAVKSDNKYIYFYHEFNATRIPEAYEPFLIWIKYIFDNYIDMNLDEFFEVCKIYNPHRIILKSYFETGITRREEFLLLNEIEFETDKLYQGLLNMITFASKIKPIIVIFNKIHLAGTSTMKFINKIFSGEDTGNMAIIAAFKNNVPGLKGKSVIWNELINNFIDINCVYDWDDFGELEDNSKNEKEIVSLEFDETEMEATMVKIKNMCDLLALNQASDYLGFLYHKYEVEKYDISNDLKFKLYKLYTKNCIELRKISDAYEAINNLKVLAVSKDKKFDYYIMRIYLELSNEKYDEAKKLIEKAKKLIDINEERKIVFLQIIAHIADYSNWRGAWFYKDITSDQMSIIEKCEKYNYKNILAHIYIYAFDNNSSLYYKADGLEHRLKFFNKGIRIAEEMGNDSLLLDAYHKALLIASSNGFIDVSDYFYLEKCMPICKKNNNLNEEAMTYIGLGYNRCTCEEFDKANEYFNKALIIYYSVEDISYMGETLYNMTINAILGEDFKSADSYITTCLAAMENLRKNSKIRVCHVAKLNALKALCCYRLGNIYKCKIYLNNTKRMIDYVLSFQEEEETYYYWSDDLFLYYFIKGMLLRDGGKYESAEEHMDKANYYSMKADGSTFFTYTQCMIEKAKLYMLIGRKESAIYALEQAIDYCVNNNLKKQRYKVLLAMREITGENRILDTDTDGLKNEQLTWDNGTFELSLRGITLNNITQLIKNIGIYNRSIEEKERVQFLSKWTKLLNASVSSVDEMINDSIKAFENNFGIDNCIYIKIEDGIPKVKFSDADIILTEEKVDRIYQYVIKNTREFAVSKLDANFYDYEDIMSVFGSARIASFMLIPIVVDEDINCIVVMYMFMHNTWYSNLSKYILNNESLSLFTSSFRQMVDAVEREKIHAELREMNNRLKTIALTDNLTGLFNRQGLQYNINKIGIQKNRNVCSILYMDLDNFKYYNDNFGHEVGDLILVSFANVIKSICGEDSFAVRYGGDEFLIILYLDKAEDVENAAKSIYNTIKNEASFQGLVEQTVGHSVDISESNRVSCSIGIACVNQAEGANSFENALKRADDALYYIKRTNKGRYEIWDNIKDLL